MVLCAVSADHSVIRLLEAPASASAGDRVTFPPFPADSVAATPAQMVKKKILEGLAAGVSTVTCCVFALLFAVLIAPYWADLFPLYLFLSRYIAYI